MTKVAEGARADEQARPQLAFTDDTRPGITRQQIRGHWAYFASDGARITDCDEIDRLNKIALPPAYTDCWYSPSPEVHLLAYGFDARGRKQYRYHAGWREEREAYKFELCPAFGRKLPKLRERVRSDLGGRGLTRERAIASIVTLLDTGAIRVGNESYAKANNSFGATTLRNRHASIERGHLRLHFVGKSGRKHDIDCADKRLVTLVKRMQDLPGQHLFQYLGEDGVPVPVSSGDVNAYIHAVMGEEFTAKHFRTWAASAIAFGLVQADPKIGLKPMLEEVSSRLGNTPAIARKSYVHPAVLAAAKREPELAALLPARLPRETRWHSREERGLLAFLDALPAA